MENALVVGLHEAVFEVVGDTCKLKLVEDFRLVALDELGLQEVTSRTTVGNSTWLWLEYADVDKRSCP